MVAGPCEDLEMGDWKFETSFGCPTFLNFGKNYAGARDGYVYVYSPDADSAYRAADRMVLARVPKGRITERGAYEFFKGLGEGGEPHWTEDIAARGRSSVSRGDVTGRRSATMRG